MDNNNNSTWQIKCSSSIWQSVTPLMPSSRQLQLQESRNQMLNTGHYLYPHVAQEPSSVSRGMIQELAFSRTPDLSSYNSHHAALGSSFLSLLSGPPSFVQSDLEQLSIPKPYIMSSKVPIGSSNVLASASGNGVSLAPTGFLPQNFRNQNLKIEPDRCPSLSSRVVASANCGNTSGLKDVFRAANLNIQGAERTNEKVNDFSSLRNGGPASAGVLSQTHTSVSHHSSTLSSDCPRVFCLGSSGYLLLSNTGLLGILCSCHGLHMSVSRYSEHSGLSNVNPGDAVRMDSGETIAQWRKLYFHKFGIRVPGDHIGWDWPEGLSPAADLVKCGATMPNTSKTLELSNPVHSSRAPVGSSEESWSNAVFPRNMDQTLVKEVLHCEKQRNCQGSCNFLHKGLIGTSQSNLRHVADKQNLECPVSENSTMSKLVGVRGPGNGFQPSSAYIDSLSQSGGGNLHISSTNLQNSKNNAKASHLSRFNKSKEGGFLNREVVTSNIELRLGQPSQPSGKSDLPVFGSCLFDTLGVPRKLLPPETLVHNTSNSVVAEDGWKFIQCSADAHGSSTRRERNQLNFVSHGSGICNAIDVSEIEQLKDDASRDSVISMFLSHLKTPERKLQFNETNHEVNDCENAVPKTYRESHIAKYGPSKYSWNRGTDGMESLLSINEIGLQKHMDKVKGVGCVATEPSFRIPAKRIEAMNGSHAVVNGTDNVNDTPDSRSVFNYPGKISCLGFNGNSDNVFVRSVSSPMQSGQPLPLQAVSLGFSTTTSIAIADPISRLPDKEGIGVRPHMLDDSLRNNVFSHVAESANQDHTVTSNETNHAKGRYVNSIHGSSVDQSTSKERCSGLNLTGKHDSCGVSMKLLQCGVTCVGGDGESLAPVTGLNNLCDFSRFLHGISVHSKGVEMQFQHSRAPDPNEQSVLRSENHITQKCCQSAPCCHSVPCTNFPGTFGADHTGLATNCNIKGKTFLDASTEQAETVGGKTSVLLSSKFGRNDSFSKAKVTSLGLSEKFGGQIQKNDCHGFQWRDVPKKVTGMCSVICEDQPALLDRRAYLDGQLTEARASKRSTQDVNSFKEQEISLISSGCSAPAITQASIEVNKMDSYTVDGADCRFASNLVVDEGSGIDKCLSSDEALESERSDEFRGSSCMLDVINEGSCTVLPNQTSRSLIDELRLQDSLRLKKVRKQLHSAHTTHEKVNYSEKCEKGFKTGKRNRATKWKVLDASFPASSISSAHNESQKCTAAKMLSRSDQKKSQNCACSIGPNFKRRRSAISSSKAISRKRDICGLYNQGDSEKGYQRQFNGTDDTQIPETSVGKKCRLDCTGAIDRMIASTNYPPSVCEGKGRPIVCGKYGVISNGDLSKPAKIIPLRKIFIVATSSRLAEDDKSRVASAKALKKEKVKVMEERFAKFSTNLKTERYNKDNDTALKKEKVKVIEERFAKFSTNLKTERYNKDNDTAGSSEMDHGNSVEQTETTSYVGDKEYDDVSHVLEKERNEKGERKRRISDDYPSTQRKPTCKETRKRSLYELTVKGKDSSHEIFSVPKISKSIPQTKCRYLGKFLRNTKTCKCNAGQIDNNKKSTTEHQCNSCSSDLDAFCCVCGSSNKDEINCLLECSQCLIRVHQACYGVSKVPKARWYCRPCRTSCKNIVCVLCGYGGGAMTRALRSHNIVKSLLKAWNIVTELRPSYAVSPSKSLEDQLGVLTSRSGIESGSFRIMTAGHIESSFAASCKMDSHQQNESITISSCSNILKVDNSITGGVLDSNVKQWVHMVCGLWTPGTRCPNVDTMSGFDVSGASHPKVDVVCSICYRPGGCCIQCRVVDCSVPFHPWCARQKGLLQSEVEGVDNEGVGFYGRCVLHAMYHHRCHSEGDPVDGQTGHQREKELTCARTEGYKGRKREGYRHNYFHSTSNGGGLVLQEQLNAWLHINGQKSCAKGLLKMSSSNIEHDCRKEYARYKQSKGWKHLVVYKSGIHALGLYTSRFISRGAMVVEYVGEIVGLRVADKRESEYQSGRKLQYKSACYFFRIDKEHIIDATCKGGIARFVNHSCLPNCVAKVICARNEKKVVFFAERDIYPGEEITYDYHFNHEEEGKKIPCFCNAKNCRRYLN